MKLFRVLAAVVVALASAGAWAQTCPTASLVVSSAADTGCDTLREAIFYANRVCSSTIMFAGTFTGVIQPKTALPALTCDVAIDGGGTRNTAPIDSASDNAIMGVEIDGSLCAGTAPCDGITVDGYG